MAIRVAKADAINRVETSCPIGIGINVEKMRVSTVNLMEDALFAEVVQGRLSPVVNSRPVEFRVLGNAIFIPDLLESDRPMFGNGSKTGRHLASECANRRCAATPTIAVDDHVIERIQRLKTIEIVARVGRARRRFKAVKAGGLMILYSNRSNQELRCGTTSSLHGTSNRRTGSSAQVG